MPIHQQVNTYILSLAMALFLTSSDAQTIETDSVYKTSSLGFSQAVVSNGFVFVSGQVGWDKNYRLTGSGSFEEQAVQSFKNVSLILEQAGSTMKQAIHLRIFVTDISNGNKQIVNNLIKQYFPDNYQPATTLICVKALAREELMIEVEAVSAIVQKK